MNEWISVGDRLPEGMIVDCLVYLPDGILKHGKRIAMSTFFKGEWSNYNGTAWPGMPDPLYWMPLPNDPAETTNNKEDK